MADRRPLVIVGGQIRELPTADAVPQAAVNGLTASLAGKEPTISAASGTASDQYWRGDKTWRDFATDVRAAVLTGLSTASAAVITATDTVLSALGKLQAQVTARVLKAGDTMTGQLLLTGSAAQVKLQPSTAGHSSIDLVASTGVWGNAITGYRNSTSTPRWQMWLGTAEAETGSNAGSRFAVTMFNDAGTSMGEVLSVYRTDGVLNTRAVAGQGSSTYGYALRSVAFDTAAGPIYVAYALNSANGGGISGSIQHVHIAGNWLGWRMIPQVGGATSIDFRGDGHIYSSNGWSSASDARVKRDIKPLRAWDRFKRIKWFSYIRTDQPGGMEGPVQPTEELGVIGQQLEKLEPQMTGRHWISEDQPDHLSVKYPQVYNMGMAVLAEAMERIEALEARLAAVEGGLE